MSVGWRRLLWGSVAAVVLVVPIMVLALVGLPHVFRMPLVRNVMARGAGGAPPALDAPEFASAFALVTGTQLMGGNSVQVLLNGEETFTRLWQDLRAARRSILDRASHRSHIRGSATAALLYSITNAYFVPHADFVALLSDAARRGVDVRVLTNGGRSDVATTWLAGRSRYETLLSAGVRIYEYQPTTLHAKTFVADGPWAAIGTANFDNRSLAYNTEDMLTVRDAALGATMDSLFLADLPYSEEIKLPAFRQRSRWMHIRERVANVVADLLYVNEVIV